MVQIVWIQPRPISLIFLLTRTFLLLLLTVSGGSAGFRLPISENEGLGASSTSAGFGALPMSENEGFGSS